MEKNARSRHVSKMSAFILLFVGTVGLLINEFVIGNRTIIVLTFAVFNVAGLVVLAFEYWGDRFK